MTRHPARWEDLDYRPREASRVVVGYALVTVAILGFIVGLLALGGLLIEWFA